MADIKDSKFVIGNATVMLAPFSEDVFVLSPSDHSLGMVKAVTIAEEADQITLTHGVLQTIVETQKSNVTMPISFEGYEFSAKNLMYALGLQGTIVKRLRGKLTADVDPTDTTLSVESYPVAGDSESLIDDVGDIPNGATLLIQRADEPDYVYPLKATADTTGSGPYSVTVDAIPTGVSFTTGDTVWVMNELDAGATYQDEYFCAKIVGRLTANDEPIVVVLPKVRVSGGFNLSFGEQDYSNLPFELTPFVMSATEVSSKGSKYSGFNRTIAKAYAGG